MKKPKPSSVLLIHTSKRGTKAILRAFSSYDKAVDWFKKVARENNFGEDLNVSDKAFEELLSNIGVHFAQWTEIKDFPSGIWDFFSIRAMVNGDFTELHQYSLKQVKYRGIFSQGAKSLSEDIPPEERPLLVS